MRSLWLLSLYAIYLGMGISVPFIATLGYVWVDTFRPQELAYFVLNQIPVAIIMGGIAIGSYLLLDRRSPPRLSLETVLTALLATWVTITLSWAEVPGPAWSKWDWAFKTVAFATFIPFVIRSRIQIEAFTQTYVLSLAANFVPFGLKTLISGGGYGSNLGLQQGNSGLAEGGLLSTICLMSVPLALFLSAHGQLIPYLNRFRWVYWGVAGLAVVTAIGTYERSALIGLVVLVIYMWIRSKHKFAFGLVAVLVAGLVLYATSSAWNSRVATIADFQHESSAYSRILVWKWTLDFVATHPLGGGFQTYLIDHIEIPATDTTPEIVQFGRAFHSIYFEMLGEQGFPGLALFLTTATAMFVKLHRISKRAGRYPEMQWVVALSGALQSGLAVFMTSGAFVGIAFQPMFWYFIALGISLDAYVWRAEHATLTGRWKGAAQIAAPRRTGDAIGWRNRRPASAGSKPIR